MKTTRRTSGAVLALFIMLSATVVGGLTTDPAGAQAPPEVGTADWRTVSSGGFHSCGIRTNGRLYCWGWNQYGQVGSSSTDNAGRPFEVSGGGTDWIAVVAGAFHTCGIRASGRLFCWGDDSAGQLGNGAAPAASRPQEVAGGARWTSVTAGQHHTCALRTNGRPWCWGNNAYGQLGDGGFQPRVAPVRVEGEQVWRAIDTGANHTCGIRSTGAMACWGDDGAGQLGNTGVFGNASQPSNVAGSMRWTQLSAGGEHTCGRARSGRLFCWGDDSAGQLGNGSVVLNQQSPAAVGQERNWTAVTAGVAHTCATATGGGAACWGIDGNGQLGNDSNYTTTPEPDGLSTASRFTMLSAGSSHTCGRVAAGRLQCWGDNTRGQVGNDGSAPSYPTPVGVAAARVPA